MPYKNIEDKKACDRRYYLKNKDKLSVYNKEWVLKNIESVKERRKKYNLENKDKLNAYHVKYRKRPGYKKKFNEYYRNWVNKRLKTDPHFKLKQLLSHRIYLALKGTVKSKRTMKLLGCTIEELWKHLEKKFIKGMTQENYGKWHVDHIKPCALFDLTDPKQQEICFHYNNLQPLWATDNLKKGAKY
tara:strand:- start:66 stop:626 length:561 start_codon:yes stop_codon:yes gene_type:complete